MRWDTYLSEFHREHAGVTERVLDVSRCRRGDTAYDWLLAALPPTGRVLDVACGSAPIFSPALYRRYVGLDRSARELALARAGGASALVRGSAAALPVAAGSVEAVACSMGLMLTVPLPQVLSEIRRVLVPGGLLVATVPANSPLRRRDRVAAGVRLALLGRRLRYPNDDLPADLPSLLDDASLEPVDDECRRLGYPLTARDGADLLLSSLYLPGITTTRYRLARCYLRALARIRVDFPVPIRRIVARAR